MSLITVFREILTPFNCIEQGNRPSLQVGYLPVQVLLNLPTTSDDLSRNTPFALRAKASVFFSHASLLASQYQNGRYQYTLALSSL